VRCAAVEWEIPWAQKYGSQNVPYSSDTAQIRLLAYLPARQRSTSSRAVIGGGARSSCRSGISSVDVLVSGGEVTTV